MYRPQGLTSRSYLNEIDRVTAVQYFPSDGPLRVVCSAFLALILRDRRRVKGAPKDGRRIGVQLPHGGRR